MIRRTCAVMSVAVVVAAGCGADSGPTVEHWAQEMCAVGPAWDASYARLRQRVDDFDPMTVRRGREERAAAKDLVLGQIDGIGRAVDRLEADLDAAGVPEVAGAAEVMDWYARWIERFRAALDEAGKTVERLPVDDLEVFLAGMEEMKQVLEQSEWAEELEPMPVSSELDEATDGIDCEHDQ